MAADKLVISGLGKTFRSERGATVALEGRRPRGRRE